jgi:hypothetical protein
MPCHRNKKIRYIGTGTFSKVVASINVNWDKLTISPNANFSLECDVNSHLLQAQKNMANWQFLTSLLQLHEAHTKLVIWCDVTQMKDTVSYLFSELSIL